jgi:hypothetical protein
MQNNLPYWQKRLLQEKKNFGILEAKLRAIQSDIYLAQSNLITEYKHQIAFCFMKRWEGIPVYKIDPELVNVIMHLAGEEVETTPEIHITYNKTGTEPHLYYKSEELQKWIEITP